MHQSRVVLPAGHREIANRQTIGQHRRRRLFFRHVHLIVRGCIDHNGGIFPREYLLHLRAVADVHLGAIESAYSIAALGEDCYQFDAKLSTASKHHRFSCFHEFLFR